MIEKDLTEEIKIIYEDADIVAIDKPAGLLVHSDGKSTQPTVVDWLLRRYPHIGGVGEPMKMPDGSVIDRPGIVHRIDKDTSGVLVIAKTHNAFLLLKESFKERHVKKLYHAIVYGEVRGGSGVISMPIGRSGSGFVARKDTPGNRQKVGKTRDAITRYRVLKRFNGYTLLEVKPETGRTHQIRVHLKSIGHPVLCDKLYARGRACIGRMERHALHAAAIELTLPSGARLTLAADDPPDFQTVLAELGTL